MTTRSPLTLDRNLSRLVNILLWQTQQPIKRALIMLEVAAPSGKKIRVYRALAKPPLVKRS